jgi:hypothetical protein
VEALLAYPLMQDPVERQTVISALDPHVTATLSRHTRARTDAAGILNGLARYHPDALWDLLDAVVAVDDDPDRKDELGAALRDFAASARRPRGRR